MGSQDTLVCEWGECRSGCENEVRVRMRFNPQSFHFVKVTVYYLGTVQTFESQQMKFQFLIYTTKNANKI